MSYHLRSKHAQDQAVSAVVGTILMVAVTVIIGATVYAAVNAYGSKGVKESGNVAFKAVAIDTDANGKLDSVKVTYLSGPKGIAASDVTIALSKGDGSAVTATSTGHGASAPWSPGDFVIYKPGAGTFLASVAVQGNAVIDQPVVVDE